MSNDELSNDELRQYIADTVGSMAAVPRRRVLVAVDVIIRRHGNAEARAEAAEALAAERAANTWRPVTADWPPRNQRVVISAPGASWADVARKQHDGEEYVWQLKNGHVLDFESATVAIPLPPAPAPKEPTP